MSTVIRQKSYEHIEYILRRHPVTFIPVFAFFLLLFSIPFGLYAFLVNTFEGFLAHPVWYPLAVVFGSIYYLSIYLFFYVYFLDYYLDVWVVTNDRIVDIEQFGLFSRTISEVDLFRIQDVTTDVHGPFATIFNYGNVSVKTASVNKHIVFKNVHRPNHIREQLIQLADQDRRFHFRTATVLE